MSRVRGGKAKTFHLKYAKEKIIDNPIFKEKNKEILDKLRVCQNIKQEHIEQVNELKKL